MTESLAEWALAAGPAGLFAAAFLGATLLPVSSEVAFVAALAAGVPPLAALASATAGNTLGCALNYVLGWRGRDAVGARLASSRAGRAAMRWSERWGALALLLSWLPVVGDPLTLAAGVGRVRPLVFFSLVPLVRGLRYAALWAAAG